MKFTFLKRPKVGVTTRLGGVLPKVGGALMLGVLAMVISPAAAQAKKLEARVCLHIPQGHNYDSQNRMPERAKTHLAVHHSPCIAGHGIHVFAKVRQQAMLAETARAL